MISLEQIYSFFPPDLKKTQAIKKNMLREYLQYMILDFLSVSPFIDRILLSAGSALRFKYGLDRFTTDLLFNYKDCSESDFIKMTDSVISFLERAGIEVEQGKESLDKIPFERDVYFPKFRFSIKLYVFDENKFFSSIGLIPRRFIRGATFKIEDGKRGMGYDGNLEAINGCGFSFLFPMPSFSVLFSMKLASLILRQNGKDFYDVLFLRQLGKPDYAFLKHRTGISNRAELYARMKEALKFADLEQKSKAVEPLLFDKRHTARVKNFWKLFEEKWPR
jgi:predicted nucleotidyltransferase component of viral defense system